MDVKYERWFDLPTAIERLAGLTDTPPYRHVWSVGARYVATVGDADLEQSVHDDAIRKLTESA